MAATFDGVNAKVFVDGIQAGVGRWPVAWGPLVASTYPVRIGRSFNFGQGFYLKAKVDDVRIYNRALSDSEVQQLYAIESGLRVNLLQKVQPSFSYLSLGTNYQLQVSSDMNRWTNHGTPFIATNTSMVYPQDWHVDNWGQLFFRLLVAP